MRFRLAVPRTTLLLAIISPALCNDLPVKWASQFYSPPSLIVGAHDCGPASVLMVIGYYNRTGAPKPSDIDSLSRWLETRYPGAYKYNDGAGSNTGKAQLAVIAKEYRVNTQDPVFADAIAENWTAQDAIANANQELLNGHPLIVGVQTYMGTHPGKLRHWMVLRGLDLTNNLAYFNDPGRSSSHQNEAEDKQYPIDVFTKSWSTQNYAVVVIHPSSSTVNVTASLDGKSWPESGTTALDFNLVDPTGTSYAFPKGARVPFSVTTTLFGVYSLSYASGGPPNSTLVGISPCGTSLARGPTCTTTINAGQTLTFELQFTSISGTLADYQKDFQGPVPKGGWRYLWNSNGPIGNPANYGLLLWCALSDCGYWGAGVPVYNLDGGFGLRSDPGGYVDLAAQFGHPGRGSSQTHDFDRFAIAAYTFNTSGHYFITDSSLTRINGTAGGDNRLVVHVDNGLPLINTTTGTGTITFDLDLGLISAGQILYVAVGPNSSDIADSFRLQFVISR